MKPYLTFPRIRMLVLCVGLALTAAAIVACGGGEEAPQSAFYDLLRFVPDRPDYREYLTFGDAAAWHASWNIPRIDSMDQLFGLRPELYAYWIYVMPWQTTPPSYLLAETASEDQRGFYGFDLFNLDRYMVAEQPPEGIAIAGFSFDAKQIADALTSTGYQTETLKPVGTLYRIRDDYEIDVDSPIRTGRLGDLNRILLLDDKIIMGKATAPVTAALDAYNDQIPSLADDAEYAALAQALDDPALAGTGQLMGTIVMDGLVISLRDSVIASLGADADPQQVEEKLAELSQGPQLPTYSLVAFVTRHTEGATYLILAAVFPQGTDAQAAADLLADRLQNYVSLASKRKLMEMWAKQGARLEKATAVEAGGLPVALVFVRVDDPAPATSDAAMATVSVPRWADMVQRRDLGFLGR